LKSGSPNWSVGPESVDVLWRATGGRGVVAATEAGMNLRGRLSRLERTSALAQFEEFFRRWDARLGDPLVAAATTALCRATDEAETAAGRRLGAEEWLRNSGVDAALDHLFVAVGEDSEVEGQPQ
jgi:hypothetical protein